MLTPRENLDIDSEDSEPAPHRNSGFRVVAEDGLQLSQFLTRISNKRSSEIRVYSFQSRKPLPMTTKMGDLPLKMSMQIWSEDLAKAIEDGLKSCHVKSADKDDAKDYKVFFIRHISSWEFFDSCETDRAQQDRRIQQLSNEVNSLRTRLENLERAQGTRWGSYLIATCQNCLAKSWTGPWMQSEIEGHIFLRLCFEMRWPRTAVTSGGWSLGRQDSQQCHAWETTAFRIFIYNFVKGPGLEIFPSSGIFLRWFFGSGQTDRFKRDRRIQQLSNEGKQFLHWVVEPRVLLKAWWENCFIAAFPTTWMRVGPVAFD